MAKNKTEEHGSNMPTKEIAEFAEQQKKAAWAKQVRDVLQLIDLENITTKSYTTYNKESLRTYLKNPLSDHLVHALSQKAALGNKQKTKSKQ